MPGINTRISLGKINSLPATICYTIFLAQVSVHIQQYLWATLSPGHCLGDHVVPKIEPRSYTHMKYTLRLLIFLALWLNLHNLALYILASITQIKNYMVLSIYGHMDCFIIDNSKYFAKIIFNNFISHLIVTININIWFCICQGDKHGCEWRLVTIVKEMLHWW